MFVVSVKTGKRRMILALAAVLVILTAALAAGKLLGGAQAAQSLPAGETNEQRLAFLQGYGWEADTEAVEVRCMMYQVSMVMPVATKKTVVRFEPVASFVNQ